ncbi:MAG: glycosyltransferase family 4 protein [Prevotella sp.]|nr:glycosyltransferase family 4 protein [Prevotella sp.]
MIKLLVDCHVFDGKFQGTRTYIQGLYSEMIKHKDIEFYFAAQDTNGLRNIFGNADNIHYVRLTSGGSLKRLAIEFPRIIKMYGIDYAHFQYISPLIKGCKEIVTIHDLLFLDYPQYFPLSYRIKNKYLFKRSAKRADILLTVSEFSTNEIVRHFHIGGNKIAITPNAVLPISSNMKKVDVKTKWHLDKYILTVGRIEPRKNFLTLLKAFAELQLHKKGYKLMIIGAPDLAYTKFSNYYDALPNEISDAVIMDKASFPELVSLYKNASLFVFPSLAEGFGIPPLEAIEYGCPLLCSNTTAMAEFGLPEKVMFNPTDTEELKKKIENILESRLKIDPEIVKKQYTFWKSADILYKILYEKKY